MTIYYILGAIGLITLLTGLFIYFFQDRFIFQPEKLPKDFQFAYENQKSEELMIETEPGAMIDVLKFYPEGKPKGLIFYLKGNTKSIKGWGKFAIDFTRLGWEVVMLDYRGFGKSFGRRSSNAMKRDIQFVYDLMKKDFPEDKIVVYGRSLGSGYAARIAAQNRPKMLILTSPIYSLIKAVHRYMPFMPARPFMRYNIPTYKYLKAVTCPVKILHGSKDKLVPFNTVLSLSQIRPELTRLYPILEARHTNIHQFEEYHRAIQEILEGNKSIEFDRETTSLGFDHHKKK